MSYARSSLATLVVAVLAAAPAYAQDHAVTVFARGGGFNAVTNLDDAGISDFKKIGYNVGGGVGVQVHKYVTVRADFTFARNEMQTNDVDTGDKLNRFFYDGAVQLQYLTSTGVEPYVFAGGGAVTLHQVGSGAPDKTRGAGTFGLGINYLVPGTGVGLFAEGKGWVYKLQDLSGALSTFDKTQVDVVWTGGLSYRFPF